MGKRNCANPGWNTIQCETGDFKFTGDCVGTVTYTNPFPPNKTPRITIFHSGSTGDVGSAIGSGGSQASHINIYLAEVTTTGFVLSASIDNYSSIQYQAIALW